MHFSFFHNYNSNNRVLKKKLKKIKNNYLSDSRIVFNLWAIVSTVQSLNTYFIVFYINNSVSMSILAVASSINTILLFYYS